MTNLPSSTPRRNPELEDAWARLRATPLGEAFDHARWAYVNAPDADQLEFRTEELLAIWGRVKRSPEGKAWIAAGGRMT